MVQHSDLSPKVTRKKCVGCGECVEHCAQSAITLKDEKAEINPTKCIGCGECILICSNGAINVQWNTDIALFQKKMAEYASGVLKGKEGRVACLNFLTQISPACDCYGHSDARSFRISGSWPPPIRWPSIRPPWTWSTGKKALTVPALASHKEIGGDKFRGLYPKVDWTVQLEHGEKIGLGRRDYDLIYLDAGFVAFSQEPEKRLTLRRENQEIVLKKRDDGEWEITEPLRTPADPLALSRVRNTLAVLKYLRMFNPRGGFFRADQPE
jgi:uncharacterized protein